MWRGQECVSVKGAGVCECGGGGSVSVEGEGYSIHKTP